MEYELIETFFNDLGEYMRFYLRLEEEAQETSDHSCTATLRKQGDRYLYTLHFKDGHYLAEYLHRFRPNEKSLALFHAGCREMARRLRVFIDTGDITQVPKQPPVFGALSCESPYDPELFSAPERQATKSKYFPAVKDARLVKIYDAGPYDLVLLTDVKCFGIIQCSHLLVAFKKGDREPSYVVASEVNNLHIPGEDSDSHFLCCYTGSVHENHGCSNDWGNLNIFERKAHEIMIKKLGL